MLPTFCVRLALNERRGLLQTLRELLQRPPDAENPVPCVVLAVRDSQLFNAIDELANAFLEQDLLTGILAKSGAKELFAPVMDSTIGILSGKMETLAQSLGVEVQMRVENFAELAGDATAVSDALLRTLLKFLFLSNGCLQFEKRGWAPQVLMLDTPRSGEVQTIALLGIATSSDEAGAPVIDLECMPKVMMLRTLADPNDPEQPGFDPLYFCPSSGSVMVMPRMGHGWLASHYYQNPFNGLKGDLKQQLTGNVKPGRGGQRLIDKTGFHRYAPETDEEFRRYWLNVHRIRLPEDFGGYAEIHFSGSLRLTYPACCIAYQWTVMPSETRSKSAEVMTQFQSLLQQIVGKGAVTVSAAHEQKPALPRSVTATGVRIKGETPEPMKEPKPSKEELTQRKKRQRKAVKEEKPVVQRSRQPRRRRRSQRMK